MPDRLQSTYRRMQVDRAAVDNRHLKLLLVLVAGPQFATTADLPAVTDSLLEAAILPCTSSVDKCACSAFCDSWYSHL